MRELLTAAFEPDFDRRAYDAVDIRIMDAGMAVLAERGTRAATTTEIARRADVGRATLHRRFATKDILFQHALARELTAIFTEFAALMAAHSDPREQVAEAFALCIDVVRQPPFHHVSAARRAELVAAFAEGAPSPLERGRDFIAEAIRVQAQRGEIPAADPRQQADALMHVIIGFYVTPTSPVNLADGDEVRAFARRYLSPILLSPATE
ncbi:TetR/AcrR family transcriptional regulator [Mycolicibacterium diernhoferi]